MQKSIGDNKLMLRSNKDAALSYSVRNRCDAPSKVPSLIGAEEVDLLPNWLINEYRRDTFSDNPLTHL